RMAFTYLVTAWVTDVRDEHRLLGAVLATLARPRTLEPPHLPDPLRPVVPLTTMHLDPSAVDPADLWPAIGGRFHPTLALVVAARAVALPRHGGNGDGHAHPAPGLPRRGPHRARAGDGYHRPARHRRRPARPSGGPRLRRRPQPRAAIGDRRSAGQVHRGGREPGERTARDVPFGHRRREGPALPLRR